MKLSDLEISELVWVELLTASDSCIECMTELFTLSFFFGFLCAVIFCSQVPPAEFHYFNLKMQSPKDLPFTFVFQHQSLEAQLSLLPVNRLEDI